MFTGIIEHLGVVESLDRGVDGGRLQIRAPEVAGSLAVGGSIAANGCCLTVVEIRADVFGVDLSGETLRKTSFSELSVGKYVNLERPLTVGKELGGHFVQGHVDGIGRLARLVPAGSVQEPRAWWLSLRVPQELIRYVAVKGSIAVDGISLTVAAHQAGIVELAIIPFTYAHTNLASLTVGDPVNLECDILAKYVERFLKPREGPEPSRLTVEELREQGF